MDRWLTDNLEYKSKIGIDKYNKIKYSEPLILKGKIEHNQKITQNSQGEEIVSNVIIFLNTKKHIQIGDLISGYEVTNITPIKDFKGRFKLLEVYAK